MISKLTGVFITGAESIQCYQNGVHRNLKSELQNSI